MLRSLFATLLSAAAAFAFGTALVAFVRPLFSSLLEELQQLPG